MINQDKRNRTPFQVRGNARSSIGKRGLAMSSVRVLVVEDFVAFQELITSMLGQRRELEIVCKVSDGLEAIRKAEGLKPDLILLDIGLPMLNGIEAAQRIRKLSLNRR